MKNRQLTQIFETGLSTDPLPEILSLVEQISPGNNSRLVKEIHGEVSRYFHGNHPHFQENKLPYHTLRHTILVVLATVRLFHGLHFNGSTVNPDLLLKGLLAAYFHDTGLLLQPYNSIGSNSKHQSNHEARSIHFLHNYCKEKGIALPVARDSSDIILYTDLSNSRKVFTNHRKEIQLAGQVVGSADLLAQMADRYYLECLPLLFKEQRLGGINRHNSTMELLEHTAQFYHDVALKRLLVTFSNTSEAMRYHFRERHKLDRHLYRENIDKNIHYLKTILNECDDMEGLLRYLKRTPPSM